MNAADRKEFELISEKIDNLKEDIRETKQNSQFRENSQKWRGMIGIGFIGLVIEKVWSLFTT